MNPLITDKFITLRNQLIEFIQEGMPDQAKMLEAKLAEKHPGVYIGSVFTELTLAKFITIDPGMLETKEQIRQLVPTTDSVLITGETGTGKEILAQALHGSRATPFIAVNCAAIPTELMESEFFGSVKGAFTGAVDKIGLVQMATGPKSGVGGTLFLDEIGELPQHMQSKLLRALQEKTARRLGASEDYDINFRIVSATNKNLNETSWKFRRDLYYRIACFELFTTPLRNRESDIELIVKSLDSKQEVSIENLAKFKQLPLMGNVRELQNLVRRIQIFGKF